MKEILGSSIWLKERQTEGIWIEGGLGLYNNSIIDIDIKLFREQVGAKETGFIGGWRMLVILNIYFHFHILCN